MNKENAAPLVAQQEPRGTEDGNANQKPAPKPIVPDLPRDVKVLQDFKERQHIPLMDMVEVVRTIYPSYDKSLHSKCAHGDKTGAMLRPDALKLLLLHFQEDGQKPSVNPERRRSKPNRCVCRVTDAVFALLQRRLKQTGQSVQDYIEALILKDLTEVKTDGKVS